MIGSTLYQMGGFLLPFLVVGIGCLITAIGNLFMISSIKIEKTNDSQKNLTFLDVVKVCVFIVVQCTVGYGNFCNIC